MLSAPFLLLRTDKPKAKIALYDGSKKIAVLTWQAHRQLAATLHQKIEELLKANQLELEHLKGVVIYEGPGSFTGLRIGVATANALAYGLNLPIVAAHGSDWQKEGCQRLKRGENDRGVQPVYGAPPHVTQQKK